MLKRTFPKALSDILFEHKQKIGLPSTILKPYSMAISKLSRLFQSFDLSQIINSDDTDNVLEQKHFG